VYVESSIYWITPWNNNCVGRLNCTDCIRNSGTWGLAGKIDSFSVHSNFIHDGRITFIVIKRRKKRYAYCIYSHSVVFEGRITQKYRRRNNKIILSSTALFESRPVQRSCTRWNPERFFLFGRGLNVYDCFLIIATYFNSLLTNSHQFAECEI